MVEEAVDAGLSDVLFVVGRSKTPLVNHFDRVAELEDLLEVRGKDDLLASVQRITELAAFHFVRQAVPKGLGDAVLQARHHVRDSAFAVLLGDDIIADGDQLLAHMIEVHKATGANVVAVQEVPMDQVSSYGVIAPKQGGTITGVGNSERWPGTWVETLVEKPATQDAPSNLAVIGRYVLNAEVFGVLSETAPGRGGEVQLTDALMTMAADPERYGGVVAVVHDGRRFDTGNKVEYLKATIELALQHPELGPGLKDWLNEHIVPSIAPQSIR